MKIVPGLAIPWHNVIVGVCKPAVSKQLRAVGKRLSLRFDSMKILGVFPLGFSAGVVGWQDHSFFDEELRIIHSNNGNVVVMKRELFYTDSRDMLGANRPAMLHAEHAQQTLGMTVVDADADERGSNSFLFF